MRQYKKFLLSAGKTRSSILISCGARLAPFDIRELRELMETDEMELDTLGDRKTALFVIISDTDDTFNFVVSILYTCLLYTSLGRGIGSEQEGYRPVLIIQNDTGNKHSPTVLVAAISSKVDAKAKLPTHYLLKAENGLELPSLVLMEQLRTIDKRRLETYIEYNDLM